MENAPRSICPQALLFSLHSTELVKPEGANFPLSPRLFLRTCAGQLTQIVALCGTTGNLFATTAYDRSPLQVVGALEYHSREALGEYFRSQYAAMLPTEGAAMLLGVDGSVREVRPEKGRKTSGLAQLCATLEAKYIDVHCPQHGPYEGYILVFDDEGKDRRQPINPLATAAWFETYPLDQYAPVDVVAGPVLLMASKMMR
ncbi:hypothetical protein [Hymenobacter koreensis]|uniref:Uncharacterized protein n=1 Tax=Hymenobacter koreensis TaxID=1084523 RepID=A0ABP8JDX9_9BACT